MKPDEQALWEAVVKAGPDSDNLRRVWPLGEALGMHIKRVEYLCRKWDRQGKCCQFGSYAIQLPEWRHVEVSV